MIFPHAAPTISFLRSQARQWAERVVNLHNTAVPPELKADKERLINRAKVIKNSIEDVTGTLPELAPMESLGLGAVPVVFGAAAVATAAAFITKWTLEYKTFIAKVQDRNALIGSGVDPRAAADIVNQAGAPSLTGAIMEGKKLLYVGGGLLAAYLLAKQARII